ncbi:hypothetical protein Btru_029773 [Bulinus truncatus]|nr:hypothetical protein Btru_029773 [Bulinus truncatus]
MGDLYTPVPTDHCGGFNVSNDTNGTPPVILIWEETALKINLTLVVVLCIIYVAVFLMAVLGNLVVLCVIVKNRRFHSATYYFIGNLAIADLLMAIICLPVTLLSNIFSDLVSDFSVECCGTAQCCMGQPSAVWDSSALYKSPMGVGLCEQCRAVV